MPLSIMTVRALEAAESLAGAASGRGDRLRTVQPLDIDTVRASVKKTGRLVTHNTQPVGSAPKS